MKSPNAEIYDPKTYRPEQFEFNDPRDKRRKEQRKRDERDKIKFEKEDDIELSSYEENLKKRLQKEIQRREGLQEEDAEFKAMADLDESSLLDSKFDFDGSGKFIRPHDGYGNQEAVDYHDHEGREHKKPVPRIIGKTSAKTEIMTEGHPSNLTRLTVMQKVEKQLRALTDIMDLDDGQRKHWFYRLKREYEQEEKAIKRLEQR